MEKQDHPRADSEISAVQSPGRDSPTAAPAESLSAKRELRKILREDSSWSMRSITVTALTGVSVAVIATQLNGIVSSVVLIAIMAFITASVSEIYRIFLALTGFGARKAAAKAARVLPLGPAEQRADAPPPEPEDPITEALEVVTSAYRLNEAQEAEHPKLFKRISYRLKNYGKANPFLWLVVLFLGIAITTVSVAYLVTDGQPPQIIQRTVSMTEQLSAEDRASIVAEAKEQTLEELQAQQPAPDQTATVDQSVLDELSSMVDRMAAMETELAAIGTIPPTTPAPTPPEQALLDRIAKLEAERVELTERIAALEAKLAASTGNSPSGANASAT